MNILSRKFKAIAFGGVFVVVACGRWFNLYVVHHEQLGFSLGWAALYGAAFSIVFYHLVDIFLARGLLQIKIEWAKGTALYLVALIIINRLFLPKGIHYSLLLLTIEIAITVAIGTISMFADVRLSRREEYIQTSNTSLPGRYLGPHVIRTIFETLFRLLPVPEAVGLYRIGNPDETSMVLLTGNYELTIRRAVRSLQNTDCWLLICDSRGINVWCSSLANHFNTGKVVRAIRESRLNTMVTHRNIILPQLCAANILIDEVREKTGFSCNFGPVLIEDFDEYLQHPKNANIRTVTFPAKSRVEMAIGTLFLPAVIAIFVFNFINPDILPLVLPGFFVLSAFNALVFPYRFISNVRIWSLVYASAVFIFAWMICVFMLKVPGIVYAVTFGVAAVYFVNEFEGWSPLVKFSLTGAYMQAEIELSTEKCTGCGTCVSVCPKGVYSIRDGKSRIIHIDECCSCKSCFIQCPAGAITHSAMNINEAFS